MEQKVVIKVIDSKDKATQRKNLEEAVKRFIKEKENL